MRKYSWSIRTILKIRGHFCNQIGIAFDNFLLTWLDAKEGDLSISTDDGSLNDLICANAPLPSKRNHYN